MNLTTELSNHLPSMTSLGYDSNAQYGKTQQDKHFDEYQQQLNDLEESLSLLTNHAQNLAAKRIEEAKICFDIGFSLQQLSKLETSTKQHSAQTKESINQANNDEQLEKIIEKSSKFFQKISGKQELQSFSLQEVFETQARNLLKNVGAMKEALDRRQVALTKLNTSEQNYENAQYKAQKGTIVNLQEYREIANTDTKNYQEISKTLQEEVVRFNEKRQKDMLNILIDFQNQQKAQAENLLEICKECK